MFKISNKKLTKLSSLLTINVNTQTNILPVDFRLYYVLPLNLYSLCPVTTEILESVPLAGRIAGFNRQHPQSGIPLHSDGNNMWLTTQLGVKIPEGEKAYIRVGPETRRWKRGECLLYDTTYEHETMNEHETQERVVLHGKNLMLFHSNLLMMKHSNSLHFSILLS